MNKFKFKKSIQLLLIGTVFTLILVSCKSLDTNPTDFVASQYYYNNEVNLGYALTGVYDPIGNTILYGGGNTLIGQFDSADAMYTGSSTGPGVFNYSSSDSFISSIWQVLYQGIERANIFLGRVDGVDMDITRRNAMKGEAKFLRAYYYFVLIQNFGSVPFIKYPVSSVSDVYQPRTPANEIYDFIISEMEEAEGLVYEIGAFGNAGRISKSAVQGVLARVCLYKAGFPNNDKSRYADALKWAKKVIESGNHKLNEDYSGVFVNLIQNRYDTKESIWEVEYYTTGTGESWNETGGLGGNNGIPQTSENYGYSAGGFRAEQYLFDMYEKGGDGHAIDLRRDWAIAPYKYINNDEGKGKQYWTQNQIYDRYVGKYRREYELVENKIKNGNGTNSPLLRYSDVLLMAAEAENEVNGPTLLAKQWVEEVRNRAFANGKALKTIEITNGGEGYTIAPNVKFEGGNPSVAMGLDPLDVSAVVNNGSLKSILINHNGTLFNSTPIVTISGGNGIGATAVAKLVQPDDAYISEYDMSNKETFRKIVQNERLKELCFEGGFRRCDLIRWGILLTHLKGELRDYIDRTAPNVNVKASVLRACDNVSERDFYLPIPLRELSLNRALVQNPGW